MLNGNIQALFDFIRYIGICTLDDVLNQFTKQLNVLYIVSI